MSAQSLLVELLTEELPPKALRSLGEEFGNLILGGLQRAGLKLSDTSLVWYATPRRLAVRIPDVLAQGSDRELPPIRLMPAKVAFDAQAKPSAALMKRLEKEGCALDQVTSRVDGAMEYVYLARTSKGKSLADGLQDVLDDTIARLHIPKVMIYQRPDGSDQKFVRPAHRLVALHGADIVPVSVLGLYAGRITEGHRFQGERMIAMAHADDYASKLAGAGQVIASFTERRAHIESQLQAAAARLEADVQPDGVYAALLDEVTALTENPAVYAGEFEREFLEVPQECLILTMRTNQKYFPLFDRPGTLRRQFLIVSNMRLDDPKWVVQGNERVVRPRLADANFFYDQDRKTRLADRVARLANVVYHNKLGTQLSGSSGCRNSPRRSRSCSGAIRAWRSTPRRSPRPIC